jgi:dTDP-4-amino-4,6-dideoxygalactose transaminase
VCYPAPLHLQEVYRHLGYKPGDLPVAERAAGEVLSLPIYPGMDGAYIEQVGKVIRQAL